MRVNNGDRAFLRRGFDLITDRALRGVGRGNGAWGNGVGPPVTKTVNWITTETVLNKVWRKIITRVAITAIILDYPSRFFLRCLEPMWLQAGHELA